MVAEVMSSGRSWKTRPDIVKADRSTKEPDILVFEAPTVPNADAARQRSMKAVEARKALAIQRFQEKMAEPVKGNKPQLIEIRAADVQFDPRYQTDDRYDVGRARRIAENWDWNTPSLPIAINIRPGDLAQTPWCPDGRHRTNAALMRFGNDVLIPAVLHRVSYEEEAAMFAHQDENRKRVTDALKFNAGKEAGEPVAIEAQAIVDLLGVTLGTKAGPRQIATKTFLELIRTKGPRSTAEALRLILEQYKGETDSLDARIIKGLTFFLDRYRDQPNFKISRLQQVLGRTPIERLMREAGKYQVVGVHKQIASGLVALYNTALKDENRLSEWGTK